MIVVVVNGYPNSGKDTLINVLSGRFDCEVRSTIDKMKEMAFRFGWNEVKDNNSRKMLSDLKKWYNLYFDGTYRDFVNDVESLDHAAHKPVFYITQAREGEEIQRFKDYCNDNGFKFFYIFVDRTYATKKWDNTSDNNVLDGIMPDIVIRNNSTMSDFHDNVLKVAKDMIEAPKIPEILKVI